MHRVIQSRGLVYVTAIFISLLLSVWMSVRGGVINPDAICYLQSAQTMPQGLDVAAHLCDQAKWPFYSLLIFYTSQVAHISLLHAANVLSALFSLISVVMFIAIVHFLNAAPRLLWFAALVILLGHEFNVARAEIIRDHGFWAFYLVSIFFLLYFFRTFQWCYALGFSASLMVATLFRIEGVIFLIALPFTAWLQSEVSWRVRWYAFCKLIVLPVIGLIFLGAWFGLNSSGNVDHLGRINELQFQLQHGVSLIVEHFQANALIMQQMLSKYAVHEAGLVLFLTLMVWYVINVVESLSLIYLVLVGYAWLKKSLQSTRSAHLILWAYIIINVIVTAIFLIENMFLSKRYLLALSLTLMLWVPFALESLARQWPQRKWPLTLALFFMILTGLSGIIEFGYSKKYISDAGVWLEKNVPPAARLYSNSYQVAYYSQHFGNEIFKKRQEFSHPETMTAKDWQQYDYVALLLNKENSAFTVLGKPVQVFAGKRGDEIVIYKVH